MSLFLSDILVGASVALSRVIYPLFQPVSSDAASVPTDAIKTVLDTTVKTSINQVVDIASSISLENVKIQVISSGDVIINFSQSSDVSVTLTAQVIVDTLVNMMVDLQRQSKSFGNTLYGYTFSNNVITQQELTVIRTNIKNDVSQYLGVDDAKLIRDLSVTVDNVINPEIIIKPNIDIPTSGNVILNITQNSTINLNIAAAISVLSQLGITQSTTQEATLIFHNIPLVEEANIFETFIESGIGSLVIFGFILVTMVIILKSPDPSSSRSKRR